MIPVPGATQGTPFGARSDLWSCSRDSAGNGIHTGVDYPADIGTTIVAARPGTAAFDDHGSSFGSHQLEVRCDDGTRDFYAHMSARLVADGAHVDAGQPIGRVGAEGNVTGPHLHFERHTVAAGPWSCSIITNPQPSLDYQEDDMADAATQTLLQDTSETVHEILSQLGQLRSAETNRAKGDRKRDAALLQLVEALASAKDMTAVRAGVKQIKQLLQEPTTEETP